MLIATIVVIPTLMSQAFYRDASTQQRIRATVHSVGAIDQTATSQAVSSWFQAIQEVDPKWDLGEVWLRVDDLCEGDISGSSQYINIQFKTATDRMGVDHFIYQIPDNRPPNLSELPFLGTIRSTAVGAANDPFDGVDLGQYEFVETVDEGDIFRIKIVYRYRNDGKVAFRYLHQDQNREWHLDYKVVYENTGQPYREFSDRGWQCTTCVQAEGVRVGRVVDVIAYPPHGPIYNNLPNRRRRAYAGNGVVSLVTESQSRENELPFVIPQH